MKNLKLFLIAFGGCLAATAVVAGIVGLVYAFWSPDEETVATVVTPVEIEMETPVTPTYTQEQVDTMLADAKALQNEEVRSSILNQLKDSLMDSTSAVESLRPFYPNDILFVSNGQYHFVPINPDLAKNSYSSENLEYDERGFANYYENGQLISHKGIDVSKFQGKINWDRVAEDGVEFAFLRVGYRGYGESGTLMEDNTFKANAAGANRAGVHIGVYFYTQALNEKELQEEVDMVLDLIRPYNISCPVVFDVEKVNGNGRMNNLSVEERTHLTKLFCEKIAEAGYKPMIYQNMEMGALLLDLTQLEQYEKWFAYYGDNFYYPYAYDVWQYSETGVVKGIPEKVDLNISFKPLWEE